MTTSISPTQTPGQQAGCLPRFIGAVSGIYLTGMVAYLALRLILGGELWWVALFNAFAVYTFTPLLILLPLVILLRVWRMAVRLGLLALLAIVWFGPFFQPQSPSKTDAPSLTIVTFNMEVGRGGFLEQIESFEAWIDENNVDVVVFQETANAILDDGFPNSEDTYTFVKQSEERREALRRSLLSRYPVLESENGNAYQRVVLDINGEQIALYNVHFAWPFLDEPRFNIDTGDDWLNLMLSYDEDIRNTQIEAFLDVIEGEDLPYIVAGDFNTSQHSIIYSELAVRMADSYRTASSGLGTTWPQAGRFGPLVPTVLRLDYIWYDDDVFRAVDAEVGPEFDSDHHPVIATLEIRTQPDDEVAD